MSNNIKKILDTTKEANAILTNAGGTMLKSSFNTAKQIANLYKNASIQAFDLGKDIVKKTVELTVSNQKSLLKTSGNALKEIAQSFRENDLPVKENKAKGKREKTKTKRASKNQKEITIDDLLN